MGVEARLVFFDSAPEHARRAADAAYLRLADLDHSLSDWKRDSELNLLCELGSKGAVGFGKDLTVVLGMALDLAAETDGAYDPTAGPIIRLCRSSGGNPSGNELAEARKHVGYERVHLDRKRSVAWLEMPDMRLDLGAVAKGYAADQALAVLQGLGIASAMVELGGDLALGEPPPGTTGWRIQTECGPGGSAGELLVLSRCGVATSSNGTAGDPAGGTRPTYLVDARTGLAIQERRCVTAIAPDGASADAMATIGCLLGPRPARRIASLYAARLLFHGAGLQSVFDGATLGGWVEKGGRYDGSALWTVEDGAIVGRATPEGKGGLLYLSSVFEDVTIECEFQIDHPFDSGVFLCMEPRALDGAGRKGYQVTLDHRPGGEIGAIYADGYLAHNPEGASRLLSNAWNHLEIRYTRNPPRIRAWLNGWSISDYAVEGDTSSYAPRGRIGIQVHSARPTPAGEVPPAVRFRRIGVRPLKFK